MGTSASKSHKNKISDFTLVKIPEDYGMLKIASYNVNLRNTVNIDLKIKEIISYLNSSHKNKSLDVISIQGIYDSASLYILIKDFKKYCFKHRIDVHFAPNFDYIDTEASGEHLISSKKMLDLSLHSSGDNGKNSTKRKIVQNIIISKHPIISTVYSELDDYTDMDDILGIQTVIGANILINKKIISIYNTNLSKDIKSANIINRKVRKTELSSLFDSVETNMKSLDGDKFKKYKKSDIHLLCGTFNISEIDDNNINDEFTEFIQLHHCIDIFRYLYDSDPGYTTSYMERSSYMFLHLTKDMYDDKSEFSKKLQNVKEISDLFNIIFKRYNIHFLDYSIIKNENTKVATYYPIECVFIFKIK